MFNSVNAGINPKKVRRVNTVHKIIVFLSAVFNALCDSAVYIYWYMCVCIAIFPGGAGCSK